MLDLGANRIGQRGLRLVGELVVAAAKGLSVLRLESQTAAEPPWRRRKPARLAADETAILLHPPSPFSRCINHDGERASAT